MSQEQEPKNLEEFVSKHKDLLTVIGVFAGITALFTRLGIPEAGNILSAISFMIVLLLTGELLTKPPKVLFANTALSFFKTLILFLLGSIMGYLVIVYTAYSIVFGLLMAIIFSSTILAMYQRFSAKYRRTGIAVGYIAKGGFFVIMGIVVLFVIALIVVLVFYLLGIPLPRAPTA